MWSNFYSSHAVFDKLTNLKFHTHFKPTTEFATFAKKSTILIPGLLNIYNKQFKVNHNKIFKKYSSTSFNANSSSVYDHSNLIVNSEHIKDLIKNNKSPFSSNLKKKHCITDKLLSNQKPDFSNNVMLTELNAFNFEHKDTSYFQKLALFIGSGLVVLNNPERADMVATIGEITGFYALSTIKQRMQSDPMGREILRTKPRINEKTLNIKKLIKELSPGSFGYEYATWMDSHGYTSDERPRVRFVSDPDLAYIVQRLREIHDFWHVLSGMDTSVEEEIGLKFFEFLHTGLPMAALSSIFGPIILDWSQKYTLVNNYLPWAIECNSSSVFLMNVNYESLLDEHVDDVRKKLNFVPYK